MPSGIAPSSAPCTGPGSVVCIGMEAHCMKLCDRPRMYSNSMSYAGQGPALSAAYAWPSSSANLRYLSRTGESRQWVSIEWVAVILDLLR